MPASHLSQMVFTFSKKQFGLLDSNSDFQQIQLALKKCKQFQDSELESIPKYRYFQIKKSAIGRSSTRFILQFIDISSKIFYDDLRAQEEYMNITTSTISHEMMNPLNGIQAQCEVQTHHIKALQDFSNKIKGKLTAEEYREITRITEAMDDSVTIQRASAKQLQFNVEGVLTMANIRSQKFEKKSAQFNLKAALDEMVKVNAFKANE